MTGASQPKRERAVAKPNAGVGIPRYELYARAWMRIQDASRHGFHLEAITLLESLMTDRLESRASYLTGKNEGFKPLGQLVQIFRREETVEEFRALVERVDVWRGHRNKALHEMAKFETDTFPTWEEQTAGLPAIVREGQALLREYAALDATERIKNGVRPPATWPSAFAELSEPAEKARSVSQ